MPPQRVVACAVVAWGQRVLVDVSRLRGSRPLRFPSTHTHDVGTICDNFRVIVGDSELLCSTDAGGHPREAPQPHARFGLHREPAAATECRPVRGCRRSLRPFASDQGQGVLRVANPRAGTGADRVASRGPTTPTATSSAAFRISGSRRCSLGFTGGVTGINGCWWSKDELR